MQVTAKNQLKSLKPTYKIEQNCIFVCRGKRPITDTKKAHSLRLLFCLVFLYEPSGLNGLGFAGAPPSDLSGVAGLNGLGLALRCEPLPELAGFMGLNGLSAEDSGDGAELAELIAK